MKPNDSTPPAASPKPFDWLKLTENDEALAAKAFRQGLSQRPEPSQPPLKATPNQT